MHERIFPLYIDTSNLLQWTLTDALDGSDIDAGTGLMTLYDKDGEAVTNVSALDITASGSDGLWTAVIPSNADLTEGDLYKLVATFDDGTYDLKDVRMYRAVYHPSNVKYQ